MKNTMAFFYTDISGRMKMISRSLSRNEMDKKVCPFQEKNRFSLVVCDNTTYGKGLHFNIKSCDKLKSPFQTFT